MGCKYVFHARIGEGRTCSQSGSSPAAPSGWLVPARILTGIQFTLSGCGYRPHMSRWVYHVPWRMFAGFLHPSTARMYDEL